MVLADAAVGHPDGTVSLIRGGITRLHVPPNKKATLDGAAVLFCNAESNDRGTHRLGFCIKTPNGELIRPEIEMQFELARGDECFHIVFRHRTTLGRGQYLFCARVDGNTTAQCPFEVRDIVEDAASNEVATP